MNPTQFSKATLVPSRYIVRSETNQRENNEDSFIICDLHMTIGQTKLKILAIADGMGGYAHGELVSQETLRKVSLALFEQLCIVPAINIFINDRTLSNDAILEALWASVEQANAYVRQMVQANKWGKAGSTIVVAAILENMALVVNLGDSPLFHYQASSKNLQKITEDHTVAGVLLRAGKISPEMALHHEGRSRLEFFVGSETLPRKIPVYTLLLAPGDLLLLCTDGVTGILPLELIEANLSDPQKSLRAIAEGLIEASRHAGESDNQTLILWRHGGMPSIAVADPSVQVNNTRLPTASAPNEESQENVATSSKKDDNSLPKKQEGSN